MVPNTTTVKFLCSYGGRITPRYPDGKLRYQGGDTRVLSVTRAISFTELKKKLGEICGIAVTSLRCQLPTDDLDALVTVRSDEDLKNLMEEYDLATTTQVKIHVFLSPLKSTRTTANSSPPPSTTSSSSSKSRSRSPPSPSTPETCPSCVERSIRNNGCYVHRSPSHNQLYFINN
ncbi:putative PB1 domain-containing protein [Arabidopsis thaliana]|uniref:PB1 domain-containing protein n=3 Tax=Arabidopsis TaxID=3701 RepID=A0A178W4C5_ARATH|nr:PB1 domain [Arabidopsis thaliana x Arabidopsis arenosa]KAG7659121.1 PB1 domain [Arabidopsis suecica]OAP13369.1 hypothetical protein AXX17_AT1G64810 [Arabidopsis thaliana]CAA0328177.1 unnamed protein product [Arabidopsis thaliana]VYS50631.1 unnamed protein product [Arabidopsis thaliana]